MQPPEVDNCTMLAIDYYDLMINSSEDAIISQRIYNETSYSFEYSSNHPNITFTISVIIVDVKGQRSNSAIFMTTISK